MEEDGELGPVMGQLSPQRRLFVRAVLNLGRNGIENACEAAREAGYADTGQGLRVRAHRLMHDRNIQAAMLEESRKAVNAAAAVVATPVCVSIAMDESFPARDRLRACEMLFNRGGMPAQTEHKVTVEHRDERKFEEMAKVLAGEFNIPMQKLIGLNNAIDAEFTEVASE